MSWLRSDMLNSPLPIVAEKVEAQAVGVEVNPVEQHLFKAEKPIGFDEALEDGILDSLSMAFT